jgi:pseudouridine-5'-phosphate glycosidase
MSTSPLIDLRPEPAAALSGSKPVVALESTLIAHGLPWPLNLETARAAEAAVRAEGAVPATIAVLHGRPTVGLHDAELQELAQSGGVLKASRRDLAMAVAQKRTAATTVAGTLFLAHQVGIRVFATGGIGGAHRGAHTWDISADLMELARTPVAVICAGAKSILDLPRTLEILETYGVPVVGYRTDEFPAFYLRSSGNPVGARVDAPGEAAALLRAHWALQGAGVVLAQPAQTDVLLESTELEDALDQAENEAVSAGIRGKELTPFLLSRLHQVTEGKTLLINKALVAANARLAAQVASKLLDF